MQDEWSRKGATLSDKSARKEFGLTQKEIVAAIDAGFFSWALIDIFCRLDVRFSPWP